MAGTVTTGWHPDPFGVHEARYFSADGQPTKLVRDRGFESYDEPPSGADEVAAAMARMSARPEPPPADAPRDPYPYHAAAERGPWPRLVALVGIVLGAVSIAAGIVTLTKAPSPGGTPGLTDVAFVTQAATRTLAQRTADLELSASTVAGGTATTVHGTGAFDLDGKAATLNLTVSSRAGATAIREILLNGNAYLAVSVNGRSFMPTGKEWIAEQVPAQGQGTTNLIGGNPADVLTSLKNAGITVRALGAKDIGGVRCTGYAVTPPGAQGTTAVWIDPQHLVREVHASVTIGLPLGGTSATAAPADTGPAGTASALSVDLLMDFSYSTAPVHVTAPPAASTISLADWARQLGTSPAVK